MRLYPRSSKDCQVLLDGIPITRTIGLFGRDQVNVSETSQEMRMHEAAHCLAAKKHTFDVNLGFCSGKSREGRVPKRT
jgi:hypothetical protein